MPIPKQDGDSIGATVTFNYMGPAASYNVGVIVEAGTANNIYMMQEYYCAPTGGSWVGQTVSVSGTYNAPSLDHNDLVDCVKVIYPSGQSPQPAGNGSLFKDSDPQTYVHQSEGEFKDLYAQYT